MPNENEKTENQQVQVGGANENAAQSTDGKSKEQENNGVTATPSSNEGGSQQGTSLDEKSFTQNQVNEIVRKRLDQDRNSLYAHYGVKDKDELESVVNKGQSFDATKQKLDKAIEENKSLKEKVAFMSNGIDPARENDIRIYFKGAELEFTDENLKKALATHPEWIKKEQVAPVENQSNQQTTIKTLGVDHEQHNAEHETEEEKQKRIFGV